MHARTLLAIQASKLTASLLRLAGSGGGALPGLVALKLDPQILTRLGEQCQEGVILVCGTNGKTTTSRMLAEMLGPDSIAHNRSGSNLARGHVAAMLERTTLTGKVTVKQAILEVDEAVLPATLRAIKPRAVVLHNLFRDQLDRYGEVDSIAHKWAEAFQKDLSPDTTLVVCADDPNLAWLALQLKHSRIAYYGIDDKNIATDVSTSPVDSYLSPSSGNPLHYSSYFLSHLGLYEDADGFKRPDLTYAATGIKLGDGVKKSHFTLSSSSGNSLTLEVGLPGLYNVYNALAATSVGRVMGLSDTSISTAISSLQSAFGRFERLSYQGKELILCLIKNPVGASEVLRTVAQESRSFNLGFLANDNFADGQDVSWYWDTPYEQASSLPTSLVCGGSRAADIALRLKYAGYTQKPTVITSPAESLDALIDSSPGVTYILSTYTASLELQKVLSKRGIKSHYWKE